MVEWILGQKANRFVYFFYSPWLLMLLFPLTPFYGDRTKVFLPVLWIFYLQLMLYYAFTIGISKRLVLMDQARFTQISLSRFLVHSWINILLLSLFFFIVSISVLFEINISSLLILLLAFSISEIFRLKTIASLIVGLENERKVKFSEYLSTFYLVINPVLGLWDLHKRLNVLMKNDN